MTMIPHFCTDLAFHVAMTLHTSYLNVFFDCAPSWCEISLLQNTNTLWSTINIGLLNGLRNITQKNEGDDLTSKFPPISIWWSILENMLEKHVCSMEVIPSISEDLKDLVVTFCCFISKVIFWGFGVHGLTNLTYYKGCEVGPQVVLMLKLFTIKAGASG